MQVSHIRVVVFPPIDLETYLADLVGDTVTVLGSKHEDSAVEEVIHATGQDWQKRLFVYCVEVDNVLGGHLNGVVSFNEVNLAAMLEDVVSIEFDDWWTHILLYLLFFKEEDLVMGVY